MSRFRLVILAALGIGLSVFFGLPRYFTWWYRTRCTKQAEDVLSIAMAVEEFERDHGCLPARLEELTIPDEGRSYLDREELPLDPWGNSYGYERFPALEGGFRVICFGSDGRPSGEGEARDIDNLSLLHGVEQSTMTSGPATEPSEPQEPSLGKR